MGQVIAEMRESRGIDPEEFAEMIETDRWSLERLERGEVDEVWGTLRLVARALRIPLDKLIELAEQAAPGEGGARWRRWSREAEATWTMTDAWAGPAAEDRGVSYPDLLGEFLDVQLFIESHGAFPAVKGEVADEGVVRTEARLLALVSRLRVKGLEPRDARFEPLPYLWIRVYDEEDREDGFVIEIETMLRALKACRTTDQPTGPVPVYGAEQIDEESIRAGDPLLLTVSVVDLEPREPGQAGPQIGIHFEVAAEDRRLYGFAMEGLTPFLAIGVPLLGEVDPAAEPGFPGESDGC
jgi:transcriptional regulator with XRE-family HTH domain